MFNYRLGCIIFDINQKSFIFSVLNIISSPKTDHRCYTEVLRHILRGLPLVSLDFGFSSHNFFKILPSSSLPNVLAILNELDLLF